MSIAIIIPTYNGSRFLSRTIESVLTQDYTNWRLTIVNDGSTDDTAEIARTYVDSHDRISLVCQQNAGVGAARNRGLAEADSTCGYVIFLDHDDIWEPNALSSLRAVLEREHNAVAVSGLSRTIDCDGNDVDHGQLEMWGRDRFGVIGRRLEPWPRNAPTSLAVLAYRNCIWSPGQVLIRKSALVATGPFDASLSPCEDWDMWLRLSLLGDISVLGQVVLNWRLHDRNGSYQVERIFQGHQQVRQKLLNAVHASDKRYPVLLVANWLWSRPVCSARLHHAHTRLRGGELWLAIKHYRLAVRDFIHSIRGIPVAEALLHPPLKELYQSARNIPSDINEHMDTLRSLAHSCSHVTEFGTRGGISTVGLLAARPKALVSYDLVRYSVIDLLDMVTKEEGRTRFAFHQADVLNIEIDETDLLFIDTWHVYDQLRQELDLHAARVRKYLVFHDTTTFGQLGEAPESRGLWPAIEEFLHQHHEWTIVARLENNNGLTILRRSSVPAPQVGSAHRRALVSTYQES